MAISDLLHSMCATLSEADLNAIRKARGFGIQETASRMAFASYYVTSIGLGEVMKTLSEEEIFTLRLLHEVGMMDISFFVRLYPSERKYGNTYTQIYQSVFSSVKKNLVRRGVLVMAEIKLSGDSVQLERWRFTLPDEFLGYLPDNSGMESERNGDVNSTIIHKKFQELIGTRQAVKDDPYSFTLENGDLYLGGALFTSAVFTSWQIAQFKQEIKQSDHTLPHSLTVTDAIAKLLSPERWRSADALEPALRIYTFALKQVKASDALRSAWRFGLIERLIVNDELYYRHMTRARREELENTRGLPSTWLKIVPGGQAFEIDLRLILPYDLEILNAVARLSIENGNLVAAPDLIKMGRSSGKLRNSILYQWLMDQLPIFAQMDAIVQERYGKTLVHSNLLVARVEDLSLRFLLEREMGDHLVLLSDHYIAYARQNQSQVDKVLKKAGFVCKLVQAKPGTH